MKIRKVNESISPSQAPYHDASTITWGELYEAVKSKSIRAINLEVEDLEYHLEDKDPTSLVCRGRRIRNEICEVDDLVLVLDGSVVDAIICENELINPFVFGDIVVCPGHDSITCYNKVTKEHKTSHIR